jgi:hypothetical protein
MKKTLVSICGAALVCGVGFQVRANTIIADSGYSANAFASDLETDGYDFTVGSSPLLITALGFWDGPQGTLQTGTTGSIGDGLANQHTIGLWDNSGNLLATAVVQMGSADMLVGEFRFSSVLTPGPVILLPGATYVLGASLTSTDTDTLDVIFGAIPSAVTSGNFRETDGPFSFPADLGFRGGQIGPNAMFTVANGVPEGGSTFLLMPLALVPLFLLRRYQQRKPNGFTS